MPTTIGVSIGGDFVSLPGVYYTDSLTPVGPINQFATGPLVFIAYGYGGAPNVPVNFTDGNALVAAMRGSPSSDFVNFMVNPSTELNGVQLITYIPVGTNTQSTASITSFGAPASGAVINLTSVDYGSPSNLISYSVGAPLVSGAGVSFTITDNYAKVSFTSADIGYPFELAYTGAATGVSYTVGHDVFGNPTSFVITSPNPGESVAIEFNNTVLSTVGQLVEFLDGTGFYSAVAISQLQLPLTSLDVIANVSLPKPVGSNNQYVFVSAVLGSIVYFVNNTSIPIATAAIANNIVSSPAVIPNFVTQVFFSGGQNNPPTTTDYANAFNVALTVPAWTVFADNNDLAVQSLGAQHALDASSVLEEKWRRFITGSSLGDNITTTITNALELNEYQATYVFPGIIRTNLTTGIYQTYDGLHSAACVAGMMTGNPIVTPLTNKSLIGIGVEQMFSNVQLVELEEAGVMVINLPAQTRVPTVLLDVTTWQNDSQPANLFNQQVSCRFGLAYALVNGLQSYVGQVASQQTVYAAAAATKAILNSVIYNGQGGLGFLSSWDPSTLVVSYTGANQALNVQVAVVLVGQVIFIPINVTINPLNVISISSGTGTTG